MTPKSIQARSQYITEHTRQDTVASKKELLKKIDRFFNNLIIHPEMSQSALFRCSFPFNPECHLKVEFDFVTNHQKINNQTKDIVSTQIFPKTYTKRQRDVHTKEYQEIMYEHSLTSPPYYQIVLSHPENLTFVEMVEVDKLMSKFANKFFSERKERVKTEYNESLEKVKKIVKGALIASTFTLVSVFGYYHRYNRD